MYTTEFEPAEKGARVYLYIPYDTPYCEVQPGKPTSLGLHPEQRGHRFIVPASQVGGPYSISLDFDLRLSPEPVASRVPAMEYLKPDVRQQYLSAEAGIPTDNPVIRSFAQQALDAGGTAFERVEWIFRSCMDIPAPRAAGDTPDDPAVILSKDDTAPRRWAAPRP